MDKNWLIRTKSNHILGPVSKEKVLELYHNGSIKPDDEICSGNGYWFFIREEELVEKYLLGSEDQSFNPISEAKDVLTSSAPSEVLPLTDDITMVGGINLAGLQKESAPPESPKPKVPPAPPVKTVNSSPKETVSAETKKKNNLEARAKSVKVQKNLKKQGWLKYAGLFGFLLLFFLVYFRKTIISYIFEGEVSSISLIQTVHAQDSVIPKKKNF